MEADPLLQYDVVKTTAEDTPLTEETLRTLQVAEGTQTSASTAFRFQGLKTVRTYCCRHPVRRARPWVPRTVRKHAQSGSSALQTAGTRDGVLTCPQEEGDSGLAWRHRQDIWAEETAREGWMWC